MSLYLEISPRQSKKTQRLLENVKKCCMDEHPCVIFTMNHTFSNTIKQRLLKMDIPYQLLKEKQIQILSCNIDDIKSYDFSNCRTFFDEFDLFGEKFWRKIPSTKLDYDKAYYSTTPRRLRTLKAVCDKHSTDYFIRLLQFKEFEYASYPTLMNKDECRLILSNEQYLTEVEGIFVK